MKDYSRLKAGVKMFNSPAGLINVHVVDYDGGDFDLSPKITDNGVVLVDVNRPSAYGFELSGDPEALKRLGNALLKIAKGTDSSDDDAE